MGEEIRGGGAEPGPAGGGVLGAGGSENRELPAAVAEVIEALRAAEEKFRQYEEHHTDQGAHQATVNRAMAAQCEQARKNLGAALAEAFQRVADRSDPLTAGRAARRGR